MNKSEINRLVACILNLKDIKSAKKLGIDIFTSEFDIIYKKFFFELAIAISLRGKIKALLNLWAVGVMLEDDLPVVQKISAVRGFLKDPPVQVNWINEWIRQVWKRNEAPKDILDFIAIDLRNHPGIAEDLKKMLFDENSM